MNVSIAASLLMPALLLASAASSSATKSKAKTTTKRGTSSTAAHSTHTGKKRTLARRRSAGPSYQTHPTPERYKEIQQSLADKGYFKGEVNGTWGDGSAEALKRFQADHKLPDDGKINALSLIELGLGPKHGSAVHPANPPETTPPPLPTVTEEPQNPPESQ